MYIDKLSEFADDVAIGAGTGRRLVGDVYSLGANTIDPGHGSSPFIVIQASEDFASAGAATVEIELVSDDAAAIATDGSATVHFSTGARDHSQIVKGDYLAVFKLPQGEYEPYLGVIANVGTAALTAGKINAFMTLHEPSWRAYPDGQK